MDFPKRVLLQGSPRRSPKATRPGAAMESDENMSPKCLMPAGTASPQRKKVLGERNGGCGGGGMEAAATTPPPQPKPASSPPSLTGRGAGPYDPKTNYTTLRPEFLRYDPERRREMLLRLARAAEVEDDCSSSSAASGSTAVPEAAASSVSSVRGGDSEAELDNGDDDVSSASSVRGGDSEAELDDGDDDEEAEVVGPARRGGWSRRLFLLLVAVSCLFCYMCCMNPAPFPVHSEDGLDFLGSTGNYGVGVHEFDSWRWLRLGPVYMMGPEDILEETTSQIVQGDCEGVVHLYNQRACRRNLRAIAMMGLGDMCPSVRLGEFTCRIGDGSGEDVDEMKEDSGQAEQKAAVVMGSFDNADQTSEVGCLGGNVSWDSTNSTSTQTAGMEEGSQGLIHQEEGEDYSDEFVPQLVSMEWAIESASEKLDGRKGLESEGLDLDTVLWQYENTAEAARAICSSVKFLWSAMEPHLLQILACLSLAAFVATIFKYYPRSRKNAAPVSQHMPSKSLAEVPVLVPHQIEQLPTSPSPLAVQMSLCSSEQPVQLTVPKQDLTGSLEVPMQLPLPKSGPSVSFMDPVQLPLPKTDPFPSQKISVVDDGNCDQKVSHDQKLQQGNAETMKASHGISRDDHRDNESSMPPVVELLGEFTFAGSSRGESIKNSNKHAGDITVQESSEPLGDDVDKMLKNSGALQTPSVRRARKEENAEKDATPTPLRRSSRLRSKVTSP